MKTKLIKKAIRDTFAWPGGYTLFIVMRDGEALCTACAHTNYALISEATILETPGDDWQAVGPEVNWEDIELTCCHCSKNIESAYGN